MKKLKNILSPHKYEFSKISKFGLLVGIFIAVVFFYLYFFCFNFSSYFSGTSPYKSPSILFKGLSSVQFLLYLGLVLFPFIWERHKLTWELVDRRTVRWFILSLVILLVYFTSFQEFNYFYARGYWIDRMVIIFLGILTFVNPFFIAPLLISCLVFETQYTFFNQPYTIPLGEFYLDVLPLYQMLFFTLSYFYTSLMIDLDELDLLTGWLAIISANFFYPGFTKAWYGNHFLDWALSYKSHYYFSWSEFQGWLNFLDDYYRNQIYASIKTVNRPLVLGIFFTEIGAVMMMLSWGVAVFYLCAFILAHLGIFIISGMLFWKWIFIELLLIITLISLRDYLKKSFFIKERFVGYLFLVVSVSLFMGQDLAWWETRYEISFNFSAVTRSGNSLSLSRRSFGPYKPYFDFLFNYRYLVNRPTFAGLNQDRRYARLINNKMISKKAVKRLRSELAKNSYIPRWSKQFRRFVKIYLSNVKRFHKPLHDWLRFVSPPHHFQRYYHPENVLFSKKKDKITKVILKLKEAFLIKGEHRIVSNSVLMKIPVEVNGKK